MKKITHIIALLLGMVTIGQAQQENHYTMFMYNTQYFNPAVSGSRGVTSFTAHYRKQWIGFKGAPESQLVSFSTPFSNGRAGLGAMVSHHSIGVNNNWGANINYAYALVKKTDFSLRAGIQVSAKRYTFDFDNATNVIWDSGDPSVVANDMAQMNKINIGAGIYALYKDSYIGISAPNIYNNNLSFNNVGSTDLVGEEQAHFYLMGGVMIPINSKVSLKPAILAKYTKNAPFDMDANLSVILQNKIMLGASYRLGGSGFGESLDALVFFQASESLGIGASYDFTLSELRSYNSGSIEALIRYDFGRKKTDLSNPRFFL